MSVARLSHRLATLALLTAMASPAAPTLGGPVTSSPVTSGQVASSSARGAQGPQVRVWIDEIEIPSYPLGADDPYPRFREIEGSPIYPYTVQDAFSTQRVDRRYRAVYLENEHLRVLCLPELGGRILSVFDKARDREMLYRNQVIRPGHIAVRGAWISGGIEWNRGPEGHGVTSFSPVSVRAHRNADGSASLLIGDTEQVHRTGWEVRLTLHPGRRVLDQQIRLFNPTDALHPYYFWNNVAFPETPGARFVFPMSLGSDHAGASFFRWPLHEGRDLSLVRNHPGPTAIFGVRVEQDFFGAYDADSDYGIVQVADHHRLPGKKVWTWGQADGGRVAQSALTDDDGPYVEVQSGPLRTQAELAMLFPGQEISWQEYWYPVQDLGDGFEYATREVAVQRLAGAGGIELRFAATGSHPAARLEVERDDGRVLRGILDLAPGRTEPFRVEASGLTSAQSMPLRVRLRSERGDTLLDYTSPLRIPEVEPPTPVRAGAPETASALFAAGWEADLRGDRSAARALYRQVLEADPGHADALRALGTLELERGLPDIAAALLESAARHNADDGIAWTLLAGARLRMGYIEEAEDAGFRAVRAPGTSALGWGVIGLARSRCGDHPGALDAFTAGLAAGGADWTRLLERILVATYAAGDAAAASALAARTIDSGTVRLLPHLMGSLHAREALESAAAGARRWLGEPDFAFVDVSLAFEEQGLTRVAADVLEAGAATGVEPGRRRAIPLYYLAWYAHRLGDEESAARWLDAAASRHQDTVFPSRPETLAVLRYAAEARPADGRVREHLGNLYAGLGRLREAVDAWRAAAQLDPGLAVARRNLAMAAWHVDDDAQAAAAWLAEALAARPDDQRLARDLARVHVASHDLQAAIALLERLPAGRERRGDVTLLLAESYLGAGRHDDALELLDGHRFTNREGDVSPWELYHRAHVARGRARLASGDAGAALADFDAALLYPENLQAGRPHVPREALALHWKGVALQQLGRTDEARRTWETCAAQAPVSDELAAIIERCARALQSPGP